MLHSTFLGGAAPHGAAPPVRFCYSSRAAASDADLNASSPGRAYLAVVAGDACPNPSCTARISRVRRYATVAHRCRSACADVVDSIRPTRFPTAFAVNATPPRLTTGPTRSGSRSRASRIGGTTGTTRDRLPFPCRTRIVPASMSTSDQSRPAISAHRSPANAPRLTAAAVTGDAAANASAITASGVALVEDDGGLGESNRLDGSSPRTSNRPAHT